MRRRLADWELPNVPPEVLGAGQGALEVPYDQSAQEVPMPVPRQPDEELPNEAAQYGGTEETGSPELVPDEAGAPQDMAADAGGGLLAGIGSGPMDSSALSEEDLAGMVDQDPTQGEADQLLAQLQDPNTPPEVQQMIQLQLQTAAKRRMAGLLGGGA